MKIILLVVLALQGQEPMKEPNEMPSMKACEAAAHRYNIAKLPDNAEFAYAACVRVRPGQPT
jgi:hypothetical protein